MKRNNNKHTQVLNHLQQYGTITSWQAIQQYGATRLASIICNLRKKGYDIETISILDKDRNGNVCPYAKYVLHREENRDE